ncbi:MAG: NADH-quinone oxidoreductase subunit NuoF [Planctomycetota bacterium]|nr:NADH-quinone oxidoreductase subunit NuoF [Planctomycetota bacterium]
MPKFEPVLLKNIGVPEVQRLDVYKRRGGYQATEKALRTLSPENLVKLVTESKLRGRGGAGFPCGAKWSFLPPKRLETLMCINADESEPGTFCNRILMEGDPHQVLEGILIGCYATQATTAYLYLRYEYIQAYHRLQRAIDEAYAAGYLGRNILGTPFSLDVYLHRGAGAYVCGEETGLIESLEGKRGWPRIKPPFPAVEGAFRKPTVINNVETLACVPHIIERGVDWFKSLGVPADPNNPRDLGSYGPKLYGLAGHINRPGCYEEPLGITCRQLIEQHGEGVWKNRRAKAAIPGGISMGLLREDEFDTRLDFSSLAKVGCLGLGTAGVVVFDEATSIVDVVYNSCRFFAHESCGQCTPCREGTGWMLRIVERIRQGQGRREDLDLLQQVAGSMGLMPGTTICGLADGAAWPVKNALTKFRGEFEAYLQASAGAK